MTPYEKLEALTNISEQDRNITKEAMDLLRNDSQRHAVVDALADWKDGDGPLDGDLDDDDDIILG